MIKKIKVNLRSYQDLGLLSDAVLKQYSKMKPNTVEFYTAQELSEYLRNRLGTCDIEKPTLQLFRSQAKVLVDMFNDAGNQVKYYHIISQVEPKLLLS